MTRIWRTGILIHGNWELWNGTTLETVYSFIITLSTHLLYNPTIPLSGIHPAERSVLLFTYTSVSFET